MLLNQDHLEDKIVLNRRAMQFQPANEFACRQAQRQDRKVEKCNSY
jgi:hypothetical protein